MTGAGRIRGSARPLSLLVTLLLALPLVGCTPPAPGDEPAGAGLAPGTRAVLRAPSGVLLARPADEGDEASNRTLRVLLDLIARTPPGARIRLVGNSFSLVPVARALVEAHARGVRVQVVVDRGASGEWQAPALLGDELGTDRRDDSFIWLAPGRVHHKIWAFTRTAGARDVVLAGSMNLTYRSAQQYTDMRTWSGRRAVRRTLDRRFALLLARLPHLPAVPSTRLGPDRAWFFPGHDADTDPVRRQLAAVPAAGAHVRVAMYAWLDERGLLLARLLADKAAAGAEVDVVLGASVGPQVREVLESSAVRVHSGVYDDGDDIHHKLAVVSHPGPGGGRQRFVLTGSDNWTTRSLDRPELLLRLEPRPRAFARYARWVDAMAARSRRGGRS